MIQVTKVPSLIAILLCLTATVVSGTGCAINGGGELVLGDEGPDFDREQTRLRSLAVGTFEHTGISGISNVYVAGSDGTASGWSVTRARYNTPPQYLVRALEETGAFKAVAPLGYPGYHHDLVLEGRVSVYMGEPWWSKTQILVLYLPAWVLPTLSRSWTTVGEFILYDKNHTRLHKWSFEVEDRYQAWIWWMIRHGGARDGGFDVQRQNESVTKAVDAIFSAPESERDRK